ncbi:MAG: alanine--tRNA ligase [Patescibacteria group bacterium]
MTSKDLKKKFLEYFRSQNHQIIDSASLIPDNDPTALFTTAGMQPLVPYLTGEKHPQGTKLANIQKCLRTDDIDEVGDNVHHTFFEMLGNWSLGDYGKAEAIHYSWEFLTKVLKINKKKLAISVFAGNNVLPDPDLESEKAWLDLKISKNRIARLADNWWGLPSGIGPCGPDTEMFYWSAKTKEPDSFDTEDKNWVEIWNDVFLEYNRSKDGSLQNLQQKNVDTGMGLERTLAVINGLDDNYLTDLFQPIIKAIETISGHKYEDNLKAFRVIADHIRSAVFIMGDDKGFGPSNKDHGYVLRRLIRRAIRFGKNIDINHNFTQDLSKVIIEHYQDDYPELKANQVFILEEVDKEETKFNLTLNKGLRQLEKVLKANQLSEKTAFELYTTYGFPLEMTLELAAEKGLKLSKEKYQIEFKKHQDLSRTASAGMFKGGLADDKETTKKHHTAAHLMLQALRQVLNDSVRQKGSNINAERIRFDFSYPEKMTPEQIKKVENIVNQQIQKKLPVTWQEMTLAEAKQYGAVGSFEHKYGDKVKVYTIGDPSLASEPAFSREICGGPHVENTSELGHFKILKEESSSAGVRRIKAILE